MERFRNFSTSIYYFIKKLLHDAGFNTIREGDQDTLYRTELPYFIKVNNGYDDVILSDSELPTIVLMSDVAGSRPLQIGGGWWDRFNYYIDVYAMRDSERDDLSYILFEGFNDDETTLSDYTNFYPTYVYSSGEGILVPSYPDGVPEYRSQMYFEGVLLDPLPRLGTIGEVDNHRAVISFTAVAIR